MVRGISNDAIHHNCRTVCRHPRLLHPNPALRPPRTQLEEGDTLNWQITDSKQIIITKIKNSEESGGEDEESIVITEYQRLGRLLVQQRKRRQEYDEIRSVHPRNSKRNLRSSVPLARTARIVELNTLAALRLNYFQSIVCHGV